MRTKQLTTYRFPLWDLNKLPDYPFVAPFSLTRSYVPECSEIELH